MSPVEDLQKGRTIAKSKVTRFGNQLSRLIAEGDKTTPFDELSVKLMQAFAEFSEFHEKLRLIQIVAEDSDICEIDEYYDKVQTRYTDVLIRVSSIRSNDSSTAERADSSTLA